MNKGGRPKDSVWAMFERSQDQKAKCKNCQALVSSKADRKIYISFFANEVILTLLSIKLPLNWYTTLYVFGQYWCLPRLCESSASTEISRILVKFLINPILYIVKFYINENLWFICIIYKNIFNLVPWWPL